MSDRDDLEMSDSGLARRLGGLTMRADQMIQDAYAAQRPATAWGDLSPADQEAFWHSFVTYGKW